MALKTFKPTKSTRGTVVLDKSKLWKVPYKPLTKGQNFTGVEIIMEGSPQEYWRWIKA